jgi:hypothetical protein
MDLRPPGTCLYDIRLRVMRRDPSLLAVSTRIGRTSGTRYTLKVRRRAKEFARPNRRRERLITPVEVKPSTGVFVFWGIQ